MARSDYCIHRVFMLHYFTLCIWLRYFNAVRPWLRPTTFVFDVFRVRVFFSIVCDHSRLGPALTLFDIELKSGYISARIYGEQILLVCVAVIACMHDIYTCICVYFALGKYVCQMSVLRTTHRQGPVDFQPGPWGSSSACNYSNHIQFMMFKLVMCPRQFILLNTR